MTIVQEVDVAIDALIAGGYGVEFQASDVASVYGWTRDYASAALQTHRIAQGRGRTRHVVGARGYGRGAYWVLLSDPGVTGRNLTVGHGQHIAHDVARRARSDILREERPAAALQPLIATVLAAMMATIEGGVTTCVQTIAAIKAAHEVQTGEVADTRHVADA